MAGVMGEFVYVSDDGVSYRIRMDASNAAAVGATAAGTEPTKPGRTHPRYLLARHPTTGRERRITVTNPVGATIVLPDFNALMAATNFLVEGRIGERRFA
jgi:hypothetical protein